MDTKPPPRAGPAVPLPQKPEPLAAPPTSPHAATPLTPPSPNLPPTLCSYASILAALIPLVILCYLALIVALNALRSPPLPWQQVLAGQLLQWVPALLGGFVTWYFRDDRNRFFWAFGAVCGLCVPAGWWYARFVEGLKGRVNGRA